VELKQSRRSKLRPKRLSRPAWSRSFLRVTKGIVGCHAQIIENLVGREVEFPIRSAKAAGESPRMSWIDWASSGRFDANRAVRRQFVSNLEFNTGAIKQLKVPLASQWRPALEVEQSIERAISKGFKRA
jgi:hypothetical protein